MEQNHSTKIKYIQGKQSGEKYSTKNIKLNNMQHQVLSLYKVRLFLGWGEEYRGRGSGVRQLKRSSEL